MKSKVMLLSIALVTISAFCGYSSGKQDTTAAEQQKITLRFGWWGNQTRNERTLKVLDNYTEANPHVTFEPEYSNFSGHWEKLAADAAASSMPDLIQMDGRARYLKRYADKGLLEPLDKYIKDGIIDTSTTVEAALAPGRVDGDLYGYNLGTNALVVIYDPEIYGSAGVAEPAVGWTWQDLEHGSQKIHDALGIYGSDTLGANQFLYFIRTRGKHILADDGKTLGYDDDGIAIEYFSMLLRWNEAGLTPPLAEVTGKPLEDRAIIHKKAPSYWTWSNLIVAVTKAAGRPLAMGILPGPGVEKGMFLKPSMSIAVSSGSKAKVEAAKFLDWFVNSFECNKVLLADRGVAVSSKLREEMGPLLGLEQKQMFDFIDLVAKHSSPWDKPDPNTSEVENLSTEFIEQVLFKKLAPEEAAKQFRTQASEILTRE